MQVDFLPFEQNDLDQYIAWKNQPEIWAVDSVEAYQRLDTDKLRGWFTEKVVNNPYVFKIIANGRFVGYIGLKNYSSGQEDVEFFIVIGALDQWGKGIGKAAMKRLIDLAKTDLGLKKIIGLVLGNNKRALRFYQRIGFQVVGQEPPSFWRDGQKYQLVRIEMLLNHPSP